MAVADPTHGGQSHRSFGGPGWRFTEWLFGIVGVISVILGLFIAFGGDDQSVGLGGDWSWEVGDISSVWIYAFLIGGGLLLAAAIVMLVVGRGRGEQAEASATPRTGLLWHTGIFLVVNAFIWVQDIAIGDGVNYAYWVTIPWGIGLTVHAFMYFRDRGTADENRPVSPTRRG